MTASPIPRQERGIFLRGAGNNLQIDSARSCRRRKKTTGRLLQQHLLNDDGGSGGRQCLSRNPVLNPASRRGATFKAGN